MAGLIANIKRQFDYGVDGSFHPVKKRRDRFVESGIPLDFQLKATVDWQLRDDKIVYDLEAHTYNDLVTRTPAETTMILILLCLPRDSAEWHSATHDSTIFRNSCYWYLPEGPETNNTSTQRVFIPRANLLTPTILEALMFEERARREAQV